MAHIAKVHQDQPRLKNISTGPAKCSTCQQIRRKSGIQSFVWCEKCGSHDSLGSSVA